MTSRAKKSSLLLFLLAICILTFLSATDARSTTDDIKEFKEWTKDNARAYLNKYKIPYYTTSKHSQDESEVLETVKHYRDIVSVNTQIFGAKVDRLLTGLKIKLEEYLHLSKENADLLTNELQHEMRQLELRGELTKEKLAARLDRIKYKALKQKWVTEAQWKEVQNDLESAFMSEAWYRRFLGKPVTSDNYEDDGFHRWANRLKARLQRNKDLTEQQIKAVIDTIKEAVKEADVRKLAEPRWWKRIEDKLQREHQLRREQVQEIIETIRDDIHGYKIFAMDYAGHTYEESIHWLQRYRDWITEWFDYVYHWFLHQYEEKHSLVAEQASSSYAVAVAQSRSIEQAIHAAETAAQHATAAAHSSASSLRAQVTSTAESLKSSFGHYWHEKERQAWKRIGYTEAQLDWLQNYLEQTFKNQKSLAKHNIDEALHTIRRFLQDARVQSATQIEHQITRLQNLLEAWKRTLPTQRDEL